MLQMAVDRLKKIKKITHIYIVTRKNLYNQIITEIDGIDPNLVIVEPSGKYCTCNWYDGSLFCFR